MQSVRSEPTTVHDLTLGEALDALREFVINRYMSERFPEAVDFAYDVLGAFVATEDADAQERASTSQEDALRTAS